MGGLRLDFGHFGPIFGLWAYFRGTEPGFGPTSETFTCILAIFSLYSGLWAWIWAYFGGLSLRFGPTSETCTCILAILSLYSGLWAWIWAYFREPGPGIWPLWAYFGGLCLDYSLFGPTLGVWAWILLISGWSLRLDLEDLIRSEINLLCEPDVSGLLMDVLCTLWTSCGPPAAPIIHSPKFIPIEIGIPS